MLFEMLPAVSWSDGRLSTGSFTVSSLTNIGGAAASDTITVSSSGSNLNNYYIIVNGKRLRHGYDWGSPNGTALTTTALAAADIARVCNKLTLVSASTTAPTVVTLTARTKGTAGNALTLVKYGSGLAVGGALFTGAWTRRLSPSTVLRSPAFPRTPRPMKSPTSSRRSMRTRPFPRCSRRARPARK